MNKNFIVYDIGFVVNFFYFYLGVIFDGKVFDLIFVSFFGLLEIKCLYIWRNYIVEVVCNDVNFFCSMVDGVLKLWIDDK